MRIRHFVQSCAAAALFTASPVLAGEAGSEPGMDSAPYGHRHGQMAPPPAWQADRAMPAAHTAPGIDPYAREMRLRECRRRASSRDQGAGGAVIGGIVGGLAGNRIAGRHHRTAGTIAGAAVGAVAGMALDKAEDQGRVRDDCEVYLDQYYAAYARPGHYGSGYAHGYYPASYSAGCGCAQPVMMMPAPRPAADCKEIVEYEYVDVPVRPKIRYIPRRSVPDKRIRIVPDKRIRQN